MLSLISPAKNLDYDSKLPTRSATQPRLQEQMRELVEIMAGKSPEEIGELMHLSENLAELNAERYADFPLPLAAPRARQAVFAFNGDVYQGLNARESLSTRDLTEAGKTLRILSGLYGLLRPLDLINPYRLEMGTGLANPRGKDLYAFWGRTITDLLISDLEESPGAPIVVNLASGEYSGAVDFAALEDHGAKVISPRFEDRAQSGEMKVISFHAKRARGLMAAHLITSRARNAAAIRTFTSGGYVLDKQRSTTVTPVFTRG